MTVTYKTSVKNLLFMLPLVLYCRASSAQNMHTTVFQSGAMIDQSLSGITRKITNSCVINFIDPKSATIKTSRSEDRPVGQMLIHNVDRNLDVTYEVKYVDSKKENDVTTDLYAVININASGIRTIMISNEPTNTPGKIYTHRITLAGYKNEVYTTPAYYTTFFATVFKGIDDIMKRKK